jgi:hypothetical protein
VCEPSDSRPRRTLTWILRPVRSLRASPTAPPRMGDSRVALTLAALTAPSAVRLVVDMLTAVAECEVPCTYR